jgi:hypothetical protein
MVPLIESIQIPTEINSKSHSKKAHKTYQNNIQQFETLEDLDAYMRTVCLKFKGFTRWIIN